MIYNNLFGIARCCHGSLIPAVSTAACYFSIDMYDDDPWYSVEHPPRKHGRYLVVQQTKDYRKYRWIRYWDGNEWCNSSLEKYGPVTHWAYLKDWP